MNLNDITWEAVNGDMRRVDACCIIGVTNLFAYLEMSSEGSCTMALEALPALSASSTNKIGTSSCSTTASLSLLALIALLTNKAQNWRQYSTMPCDLGCSARSAAGSMRRVGGTLEEP